MSINFTIFNEMFSFICFFVFVLFKVFPCLIEKLNNFTIIDYKKDIYIKQTKLFKNLIINKTIYLENILSNNFTIYYKNIRKHIFNEKEIFINYIKNEKNFFIKNIENIKNNENYIMIKNLFNNLKISFANSFKNVYNEIINYNNEFIINCE